MYWIEIGKDLQVMRPKTSTSNKPQKFMNFSIELKKNKNNLNKRWNSRINQPNKDKKKKTDKKHNLFNNSIQISFHLIRITTVNLEISNPLHHYYYKLNKKPNSNSFCSLKCAHTTVAPCAAQSAVNSTRNNGRRIGGCSE